MCDKYTLTVFAKGNTGRAVYTVKAIDKRYPKTKIERVRKSGKGE